jgi:alpha-D-ribose 1-methylphosphonate 5-triphosphate synthase subunit PhnH
MTMATSAQPQSRPPAKVIASQSTFRAVMDAMARPGSPQSVAYPATAPAPMMPGTAAIALALFDQDTPVWLDPAMASPPEVAQWIRFQTGAPVTSDPMTSSFAVVADLSVLPTLDRFAFGSNDYPDRSTTLIVQVASLREGNALRLRGPGIKDETTLNVSVDANDLVARLSINEALFPRGIDVVLVADNVIAAIPRTTRLTASGG